MGAAGRRGELRRESDTHADDEDIDAASDESRVDDIEEWSEMYADELTDIFHALQDHCNSYGYAGFLERASYPSFVQCAFDHSSRRPPKS